MTHFRGTRIGRCLLLALCLLGATALPPAAAAAPPILAQAEARISPSRAAGIVQERFGGRVLKVDTREHGDRVVHRVKILQDNGRIQVLKVDGQSGQILR